MNSRGFTGLWILMGLLLSSCSDPAADFKAGLSPARLARGYTYSEVLRNTEYNWDQARLRISLRAPNVVLPGNRMVWPGVTREEDLTALLFYLEGMTGVE